MGENDGEVGLYKVRHPLCFPIPPRLCLPIQTLYRKPNYIELRLSSDDEVQIVR